MKKFKAGDKWKSDFDYDGMLTFALTVDHTTALSTLNKLHESATDVNYHTAFANLGNAINWIEDDGFVPGEGKAFMKQFHTDINNEINLNK